MDYKGFRRSAKSSQIDTQIQISKMLPKIMLKPNQSDREKQVLTSFMCFTDEYDI